MTIIVAFVVLLLSSMDGGFVVLCIANTNRRFYFVRWYKFSLLLIKFNRWILEIGLKGLHTFRFWFKLESNRQICSGLERMQRAHELKVAHKSTKLSPGKNYNDFSIFLFKQCKHFLMNRNRNANYCYTKNVEINSEHLMNSSFNV